MWRQGDLLIVRDQNIKQKLTKDKLVLNGIVELGEATGHAHVLEGGEVFDYGWGGTFLRSTGESQLVHDEHETITLPEGEYRVIRQRQHEDDGQWSNVVD